MTMLLMSAVSIEKNFSSSPLTGPVSCTQLMGVQPSCVYDASEVATDTSDSLDEVSSESSKDS